MRMLTSVFRALAAAWERDGKIGKVPCSILEILISIAYGSTKFIPKSTVVLPLLLACHAYVLREACRCVC